MYLAPLLHIKRLLCHSLVLLVMLLNMQVSAKSITLPKDVNGSAYRPSIVNTLVPGDTLLLEGNYNIINLILPDGTPEKPIVITNNGPVKVSGYNLYCVVIQGKYWKLVGDIEIFGTDAFYSNSGISLESSSNYEISGVTIHKVAIGLMQNKSQSSDLNGIYIHDNHIYDTMNEGFYFGISNNFSSPGKFRGCRIENNVIENTGWDGIQCGQGDFIIKGNTVRGWGRRVEPVQRAGIIIGNETTSVVEDNVLDGGHGIAYQNFGGGLHTFKRNVIKNVDLSALSLEDLVYINGRIVGFSTAFIDNIFDNNKVVAKLIRNATQDSLTNGSVFCSNIGVSLSQVQLNKKDTWGCIILPVEEDEPKPPHKPKPNKGKYKVYNLAAAYLGNDKKNLQRGWYILKYEDGATEFLRVEK